MWVDLAPGQGLLGHGRTLAELEPASQWAAFLRSSCFRFLPWSSGPDFLVMDFYLEV